MPIEAAVLSHPATMVEWVRGGASVSSCGGSSRGKSNDAAAYASLIVDRPDIISKHYIFYLTPVLHVPHG
jgi:hypothetical protein